MLIGAAFGKTSPVAALSETLYLDVRLAAGGQLRLDNLPREAAVNAVSGAIALDGEDIPSGVKAALDTGVPVTVSTRAGAQFVVIGKAPLDGHRYIFWNFDSSRQERIAQAAQDWEQQCYPAVPGEEEFIPLPRQPRQRV